MPNTYLTDILYNQYQQRRITGRPAFSPQYVEAATRGDIDARYNAEARSQAATTQASQFDRTMAERRSEFDQTRADNLSAQEKAESAGRTQTIVSGVGAAANLGLTYAMIKNGGLWKSLTGLFGSEGVLPAVVSPPETTATAAFAGGTPVAAGAAAPGTAALPAIVDSGATVAAASGSQAGITGGAAGGASTLGATAAEVGGAEVTGGVGAGAAEVGGAEVAGGVGASAGEGLTAAGAGSAGATAFIAAGAAVLAAKILPGTIAGAAEGAKSVISGIGQSTQQFFSGICFLAGTPISMMDGSTRPVESVELFDAMLEGGMCNGKGQSLAGDVYHYNGVYVTGTHAVLEDGKWIRVKDSKQAIMLDAGMQVVYILNNENHRIIVNGITFSDFEEISGSEFMSPDERLKRMNDAL